MHFTIITSFLVLASYTTAQSLPEGFTLPDCIRTCLQTLPNYNGPPSPGTCDPANFACICASGGPLNDIGCCLASSCSKSDQETAVLWADEMCSKASSKPDNKVYCLGQATVDITGSLTATPNPGLSSLLSDISEYSRTATATQNPTTIVHQRPETFSTPPSAITTGTVKEEPAYTESSTQASTISEEATITFSSMTTTTRGGVPVYNGTFAASPPAFTGAAAGYGVVGGARVMGGIVAALAGALL